MRTHKHLAERKTQTKRNKRRKGTGEKNNKDDRGTK